MPKEPPVTTKYQPAKITPSKRAKKSEIKQRPRKKKHNLHTYIAENEESGLPIHVLIEQYREYDCNHREEEVIATDSKQLTLRCTDCRRIRNQRRAGVLKHET